MFWQRMQAAIEIAPPEQFDYLSDILWKGHAGGHICDEAAQRLAELIQLRRRLQCPPPGGRFKRPPPQRSPDRQRSIERRRQLAASGPLPPHLAARFTTGEQAALKIIGEEHVKKGYCDRSNAEIAARAGVSVSTVQRAVRMAAHLLKSLQRPRPGRKNLTNLITIKSPEWLAWLARRRRPRPSIGFQNSSATVSDFSEGAPSKPVEAQSESP